MAPWADLFIRDPQDFLERGLPEDRLGQCVVHERDHPALDGGLLDLPRVSALPDEPVDRGIDDENLHGPGAAAIARVAAFDTAASAIKEESGIRRQTHLG